VDAHIAIDFDTAVLGGALLEVVRQRAGQEDADADVYPQATGAAAWQRLPVTARGAQHG
jgi:hypothetical protein